jgi:hypothetical protein
VVTISGANVPNINFTANAAPAAQSIFTTQVPAGAETDGPGNDEELGTVFTSSVAGQITGIRFYKVANETGAIPARVGRIWSITGTLLAQVNFGAETASGWQTVNLTAPLAITANTQYVVTVNSRNAYYAYTNSGLASSIANGSLSTVVGTNGRFTGTLGTFPTSSFQNSNYFRDVVFVAN